MYLTEKEILSRQQGQLYGIQKMIKNCKIDLDDITALIPGLVHLNKVHTLDLIYLDKQSREILDVKKEELTTNGARILQKVVKPESFQQAKRQFGKNDFADPSQVISHFQALKGFSDAKDYQWYFSVKKRFDKNLIMTISNAVSTLGPMQQKLEKILEENLFIKKNLSKLNSLTPREKEIIKLILKGYNTKQVAEELFISAHTVSTHRKNIWHKLEISSYTELYKFAGEFDLV
jgi:DNA-binding CsgD family transcriptional regulator/DNA-binding FrmR family transcriptional regulator